MSVQADHMLRNFPIPQSLSLAGPNKVVRSNSFSSVSTILILKEDKEMVYSFFEEIFDISFIKNLFFNNKN